MLDIDSIQQLLKRLSMMYNLDLSILNRGVDISTHSVYILTVNETYVL